MINAHKPSPPYILELNTDEGFDKMFWSMTGEYTGSYELAYEATERLFIEYFGRRRYANYESYRISRNRKLKK